MKPLSVVILMIGSFGVGTISHEDSPKLMNTTDGAGQVLMVERKARGEQTNAPGVNIEKTNIFPESKKARGQATVRHELASDFNEIHSDDLRRGRGGSSDAD